MKTDDSRGRYRLLFSHAEDAPASRIQVVKLERFTKVLSATMASLRHFAAKHSPQHLPIVQRGGRQMRNMMAGLVILGPLVAGTGASAAIHPVAIPASVQAQGQKADWDDCGPRCREHRREARQHEWRREQWAQHRRWEESHRYPPANGYYRGY